METAPDASASLISPRNRGGVIGGAGYDFQAMYLVTQIPLWLSDESFAQVVQEGVDDIDVRLQGENQSQYELLQVKNHQVTPAEFREVIARFAKMEEATGGSFARFTLACPSMSADPQAFCRKVDECRETLAALPEPVKQATLADLQSEVKRLNLRADLDFLLQKVYVDPTMTESNAADVSRGVFKDRLAALERYQHASAEQLDSAHQATVRLVYATRRKPISRAAIEGLLDDRIPPRPADAEAHDEDLSLLAGWIRIDDGYLSRLPPLEPKEVLRYFDGAEPTWRHALAEDAIPRRQHVEQLSDALARARTEGDGCSLHVILGAGGEGKSTVLLQSAVDAVRTGDWSVIWRPEESDAGLDPTHVASLDPSRPWLLVSDDGQSLVDDVLRCADCLHREGRTDVHFLLSAREPDWRARGGYRTPWESHFGGRSPNVVKLRGVTGLEDALGIVKAWAKCGQEGLRALRSVPTDEERAQAFVRAIVDADDRRNRDEGSFFGGLLGVRLGTAGLRAHLREALVGLHDIQIEHSPFMLSDALLYIAACHSTGIPGIDEKVLADLLCVPRRLVHTRVVRPLGEEAPAVRSAAHVFTRHRKVADAAVVEAVRGLGIDLPELWAELVRQTVRTGWEGAVGRQSHSRIVHACRVLQDTLPALVPEQVRMETAIAAAGAAAETEPIRLSYLVDLGKTLRGAGRLHDAVRTFRDHQPDPTYHIDYREVVRGCWYEWGVCEGGGSTGVQFTARDAWLQGISLSDHLDPAPITREDMKLICAGLGVAFGKLAQPGSACPFARARRAAARIGRLTEPDPTAESYYDRYDRDADRLGTPHPEDAMQAVDWLQAGVRAAWGELADEFLRGLLRPEILTFKALRRFVAARTPSNDAEADQA